MSSRQAAGKVENQFTHECPKGSKTSSIICLHTHTVLVVFGKGVKMDEGVQSLLRSLNLFMCISSLSTRLQTP